MGYWGNLFDSFSPGGQTPIAALFGIDDSSGNFSGTIMDNFYTGDSWVDYPEALSEKLSNSPLSDVVEQVKQGVQNAVDSVTPHDSEDIDDSYLQDLYDKILSATEQYNNQAQSSADRAMEFSEEQAQLQRDWQAEQNQIAMDYQTEMSNTAYQRAMADMQAAGLNPKLVGQLGSASSPGGISSSSGGSPSGQVANLQIGAVSSLASLMSSYVTSANSLDVQENDFVMESYRNLFSLVKDLIPNLNISVTGG